MSHRNVGSCLAGWADTAAQAQLRTSHPRREPSCQCLGTISSDGPTPRGPPPRGRRQKSTRTFGLLPVRLAPAAAAAVPAQSNRAARKEDISRRFFLPHGEAKPILPLSPQPPCPLARQCLRRWYCTYSDQRWPIGSPAASGLPTRQESTRTKPKQAGRSRSRWRRRRLSKDAPPGQGWDARRFCYTGHPARRGAGGGVRLLRRPEDWSPPDAPTSSTSTSAAAGR